MRVLLFIFLFYIGFYYYRLAENHKKNKWVFGVCGIIVYLLSANFYYFYLLYFNVENYSEFNEFSILYKTIGVGLISVVSVFQILSFIWSKKTKINKKEIDKIGK